MCFGNSDLIHLPASSRSHICSQTIPETSQKKSLALNLEHWYKFIDRYKCLLECVSNRTGCASQEVGGQYVVKLWLAFDIKIGADEGHLWRWNYCLASLLLLLLTILPYFPCYHTYHGFHYGNSILTILTMPQCHSASTWGNFATILLLKLLHFYPTIMMFYPTTYLFLWWWNYSPVICCSENLCAASIILVAATAGNSGVSKHQ